MPSGFAEMTGREYHVVKRARFDERMLAQERVGWLAWRVRAIFRKQPETLDQVLGDQYKVWRMSRAAEAEKKKE